VKDVWKFFDGYTPAVPWISNGPTVNADSFYRHQMPSLSCTKYVAIIPALHYSTDSRYFLRDSLCMLHKTTINT